MKVFNFRDYTIVAESWETRSAWGHTATILKNNNEISYARVRYYNRTWECYQYQSVILQAIDNLIKEELAFFIDTYKETQNIKRLKKEQKEALIKQAKETILSDLYDMYEHFAHKGEYDD